MRTTAYVSRMTDSILSRRTSRISNNEVKRNIEPGDSEIAKKGQKLSPKHLLVEPESSTDIVFASN
jgi:hypothetical protein